MNLIPGIEVKCFASQVLGPGNGMYFEPAFKTVADAFIAQTHDGQEAQLFWK